MIAPEGTFRTVHVLRHTFRPSDSLAEKLGEFLIKKPRQIAPRFLLESTRAVALDAVDLQNYRYEKEIQSAEATFSKEVGGVALKAVANRVDLHGNIFLRFTPVDMPAFVKLTNPIDELPGIVEQTERNDEYFIKLMLGRQALAPTDTLKKAWADLKQSFNDPNDHTPHIVLPNDISGPEKTVFSDYTDVSYR